MTSKLKCPFCREELDWCLSCPLPTMSCPNHNCKAYDFLMTQNCWQALIQSLKDRKELAIKLAQTTQNLEQSEKCCSAWETRALDYKAETIALSGELEIAKSTLKFYADRRHYKDEELDLSVYEWYEKEETGVLVLDDGGSIENGKKARDTLKQLADTSKMI